ncbi:MAG TPA: hypothetical protein PLW34_07140 [Termitinemataceae bacterium]|nr:hypothetical protein [Termitinemataceae bacterium]HPQ00635.1 hypothetical protein [Termitinemataceae bacterium]
MMKNKRKNLMKQPAQPFCVGSLVPVLLAALLWVGAPAAAETTGGGLNKTSALSVGFSIHEWEDDFGLGGTLTSPWFLWNHGALRLSGAVLFKENFDWQPYYSLRAGLVGGSFMKTAAIRLYGEGGFLFVFPHADFDAELFRLGGYGHFGFEFFLDTASWPSSYYIELGSNGILTKDINGTPYLNGFALSCGMRLY